MIRSCAHSVVKSSGNATRAFAKQCGALSVAARFLLQRQVQQGVAMSRIQVEHLTETSGQKADTVGMFQIGEPAPRWPFSRACIPPAHDIVVQVGIYRPGPSSAKWFSSLFKAPPGPRSPGQPSSRSTRVERGLVRAPISGATVRMAMIAAGFRAEQPCFFGLLRRETGSFSSVCFPASAGRSLARRRARGRNYNRDRRRRPLVVRHALIGTITAARLSLMVLPPPRKLSTLYGL